MSSKFSTSKFKKLIFSVIICLILIFLVPGNFFAPLRGFFLTMAYPFQKIFYLGSQKIENISETLSSISEMKKENEKLLQENSDLAAKISQLQEEDRENEILREQLELAPRQEYSLEAALVIGQDYQNKNSWLISDKGKLDGIEPGMPVVVSQGILVGRVSEVYPTSSKIILLSDSSSSVNAIDSKTGAKGIVNGKYNLGLFLEMVEQSDVLNIGDEIVTSGLGGTFPKGLLIGYVQESKDTQDKLFQQALIETKINYSDLEVVFIVK